MPTSLPTFNLVLAASRRLTPNGWPTQVAAKPRKNNDFGHERSATDVGDKGSSKDSVSAKCRHAALLHERTSGANAALPPASPATAPPGGRARRRVGNAVRQRECSRSERVVKRHRSGIDQRGAGECCKIGRIGPGRVSRYGQAQQLIANRERHQALAGIALVGRASRNGRNHRRRQRSRAGRLHRRRGIARRPATWWGRSPTRGRRA